MDFGYRELKVWKKAMGLAKDIVLLIDKIDLPRKHSSEDFNRIENDSLEIVKMLKGLINSIVHS